VRGVTSLDNLLYVLRENESSEQIEVYDIGSNRFLHCLTVTGLGNAFDIVACGRNRCAYVSDTLHRSVQRVPLSGTAVAQWSVIDAPSCLSVSFQCSVLVTFRRDSKIKEFTTNGQLLREVVLPQDVLLPGHTVQLSTGDLVVCHGAFTYGDSLHRVCLVGSEGQLVKSYGGSQGSGSQEMNTPVHMAVDGNNFVFVVNRNIKRVMLFSPALTYTREVLSPKQLQSIPYRLSLDRNSRRLHVAVQSTSANTVNTQPGELLLSTCNNV